MIQLNLNQMMATSTAKTKRSTKIIFSLYDVTIKQGNLGCYKSSKIVKTSVKTF